VLGRLPDLPRLAVVWADGAYAAVVEWVQQQFGWVPTTILRPLGAKGYIHLPKRWIVERTFGWLGRYRRLGKDYEHNPASSEAWIYLAMTHRMARKLLPARDPENRLRRGRPRRRRRRNRVLFRRPLRGKHDATRLANTLSASAQVGTLVRRSSASATESRGSCSRAYPCATSDAARPPRGHYLVAPVRP
jgi:hypothetical protein